MSVNEEVPLDEWGDPIECLDAHHRDGCKGPITYWMRPSDWRSFPRCEHHGELAQRRYQEIEERYPRNPPSDWSPLDAGESWDEDY